MARQSQDDRGTEVNFLLVHLTYTNLFRANAKYNTHISLKINSNLKL